MASWKDVAGLALALPETSESTSYGSVSWKVKDKGFVWERPLRKSDLKSMGDETPFDRSLLVEGPILAASVDGLAEKEAVLAAYPDFCFTIPHFDNYPAVLLLLDRVDVARLRELVLDAWLARAPKRLVGEYLADHPRS